MTTESNGERLVRIETKLDGFLSTVDAHSKKIESLQSQVTWSRGVGAAIIFVVTFFSESLRAVLFGR
jgi:hypothetical protein